MFLTKRIKQINTKNFLRFFRKTTTLKAIPTQIPRVITVDKNPAYPKAIKELKAAEKLPEIVKLRQIKYLNKIVEQDHRGIKRLVKPDMEFGFNTARRTLRGYEIVKSSGGSFPRRALHEYDEKRTSFRSSQGSRQRAGSLPQPNLWSNCII